MDNQQKIRESIAIELLGIIRESFMRASILLDSVDYLSIADFEYNGNITEDIIVLQKAIVELRRTITALDMERARRNP